jgi:hypothetical protein
MKLPGAYKGARRRREPPIAAECPGGWKSKPMSPRKAEKLRDARRASTRRAELRCGEPMLTRNRLSRKILSCRLHTFCTSGVDSDDRETKNLEYWDCSDS